MKPPELPELNELLRLIREIDASQLALARSTGIPQSVISRILSGKIKDPSYGTVRRLVIALNSLDQPESSGDNKGLTAGDLMNKDVVAMRPSNRLADAWKLMKERNFSQIPVFDDRNRTVGSISEAFLAQRSEYEMGKRIDEHAIEDPFPTVGKGASHLTVADILKTAQAVLVVENGRVVGIITRHDLIEASKSI